mmetsp:Transcript_43174/g.71326  ORF Transcript_43174/g.71326 Transcript_43174/m.71326 type:complete len:381 (+) Transcript_43174:42-1184(+)
MTTGNRIQVAQPMVRIKMKDFLKQWDVSSKKQRAFILERFIHHFGNDNKAAALLINNLDVELGEIAPLFFSRIVCSFQMNHMKRDLILLHLECIFIYLRCQQSKQYLQRFISAGGIQLTLHVLQQQQQSRQSERDNNIDWKCLLILQRAIQLSAYLKQLICMNEGIPLLLSMCLNAPVTSPSATAAACVHSMQDWLYLLYDILKQLCIRNSAYRAYIHQCILNSIDDIDIDAYASVVNTEAIKLLLQVLQNTLILDDDNNGNDEDDETHAQTQSFSLHSDRMMKKEQIHSLLKLIQLKRHQIIYELHKLCHILFQSSKIQFSLLASIIHFVKEANSAQKKSEDDAIAYRSLLRALVHENESMLSAESKQLLTDNNVNIDK